MKISDMLFLGAGVLVITPFLSGKIYAQDMTLSKEGIVAFYQEFSDAKILGGDVMVSSYESYYDENTHVTLRISNVFPPDEDGEKEDISEEDVMEHDFNGMMNEANLFSKILDYKSIKNNFTDFYLNEDGQSAHVKYTRYSDFLMDRYGFKAPFKVKEMSICEDDLHVLNGEIKVMRSDCKVKLYIDRKA